LRNNLGILFCIIMDAFTSTNSFSATSPADKTTDNLSSWSKRWDDSLTGWHRNQPHHFLMKYGDKIIPNFSSSVDSATTSCKEDNTTDHQAVRIFVPLCGKTVDMAFLAEHNGISEVVGIDGVQKALEEFSDENPTLQIKQGYEGSVERFLGKGISLFKGDFFELNYDDTMTSKKFDCILDRASLVAIQPQLREKYVDIIGKLVKPGASILLITVDRREGTESAKLKGPPFSVDENEVIRLFQNRDWVQSVTKLDEVDEFENDKSRIPKWKEQGLTALFEVCFLIQVKK